VYNGFMGFLVDPNVAYVLLVFGFLVAILALLAPGTGILELIALAILGLAGYGIANLSLNWWAPLIMLSGMIPFAFSFRQPAKTRVLLLALASLAFFGGSAFLFRGQGWQPAVSPVLVLLLTPIAVGLTWLIAAKSLQAAQARPSFDLEKIVGMTGQANNDIRGQGSVHVNGEDWSATSRKFIPAGGRVRVLSRSGLVLEVEPI
jgi:membrane-bound serine protease (ClpP class)